MIQIKGQWLLLVLAALFFKFVLPSLATAQTPPTVNAFGSGLSSCASWLNSHDARGEGDGWILGFWSGANVAAWKSVGSTTDAHGVIGEVELVCRKQPSLLLATAVWQVWKAMKNARK